MPTADGRFPALRMTAGGAIARRIRERAWRWKSNQAVLACMQGYSWGYDEGGIWVDHGCRAYFRVEFEAAGRKSRRRIDCALLFG